MSTEYFEERRTPSEKVERRTDQKEILQKLDSVIEENLKQDSIIDELKDEIIAIKVFIEGHMDWEEKHQKLVLKIMSGISALAVSLIGYILVMILGISENYQKVQTKVLLHKESLDTVSGKQDKMLDLLYSIKNQESD